LTKFMCVVCPYMLWLYKCSMSKCAALLY